MNPVQPYGILLSSLDIIERDIYEKISIPFVARRVGYSGVHLARMFRFAFGQPLAAYIRARKLSVCLPELLDTGRSVLQTALAYGFEHEQSFTRAFKARYGITPGEYRRDMPLLEVTPPLKLFDKNRLKNGALFGPEIVFTPEIHLAGHLRDIPFRGAKRLAPAAALDFWDNERCKIKMPVSDKIYYGLTRDPGNGRFTNYLSAVNIDKSSAVPNGFTRDVFPSCQCARFWYIGAHHYREINIYMAKKMYNSIRKFGHDNSEYKIDGSIYLEIVDTRAYDGTFCRLEWLSPIVRK